MFNDKVTAKTRSQFNALPIKDNHLDRRDVSATSNSGSQHYGMIVTLAGAKWSNIAPIPSIGNRVTVTMNGFGPGTVRGYFTERDTDVDYQGIYVECDNPPNWFINQCVRQNERRRCVMVFGSEIRCEGETKCD